MGKNIMKLITNSFLLSNLTEIFSKLFTHIDTIRNKIIASTKQ